jgi:hypothetical protein
MSGTSSPSHKLTGGFANGLGAILNGENSLASFLSKKTLPGILGLLQQYLSDNSRNSDNAAITLRANRRHHTPSGFSKEKAQRGSRPYRSSYPEAESVEPDVGMALDANGRADGAG